MSDANFSRRFVAENRVGSGKLAERASVVYFAKRGRDGAIKIGVTTDLRHRIYRLRNTEHDIVEVVGTIPGTRYIEAQLHRALADDALGGEWFKPTERVMAAVAGKLVQGNDDDPFAGLPKPPSRRPMRRAAQGGTYALRDQINDCWFSGLTGRETAAMLQVSVSRLTREVILMKQSGWYFQNSTRSNAA